MEYTWRENIINRGIDVTEFQIQPFEPQTFIRASNAIEGIYDTAEVKQSLLAWEYLDSLDHVISHHDIQLVQSIITAHQPELKNAWRGTYRSPLNTVNVRVGTQSAPHFDEVSHLMDEWVENAYEYDPLINHIRFEKIHPFADGNGRTGRMLYWLACRQHNIMPYYFNADNSAHHKLYYTLFQ